MTLTLVPADARKTDRRTENGKTICPRSFDTGALKLLPKQEIKILMKISIQNCELCLIQ